MPARSDQPSERAVADERPLPGGSADPPEVQETVPDADADAVLIPAPRRQRLAPRAVVVLVTAPITVALLLLMAGWPAPYVVQSPGPTVDTLGTVGDQPLIEVTGADTYPTEGALRLTTVSVLGGPGSTVDPLTVLRGWLSGASAVVPVEQAFPDAPTTQERRDAAQREMTSSQENATVAALTTLGVDVPATLTIAGVVPGSGADGVLDAEDVIVGADGRETPSFQALIDVLAQTPPGTPLGVDVERAGQRRTLTVLTQDDGTGGSALGVFIDPEFDFPVDVSITIEEIGGPSAGTMLALGILDLLTPEPLTGGADVAGTGTITVDGEIGPVGGVRQKLVGARRDGAIAFLTPEANCAEVVGHVPAGLDVVPVRTLAQARDAVTAIGAGQVADLPGCDV